MKENVRNVKEKTENTRLNSVNSSTQKTNCLENMPQFFQIKL